MTTKKSLRGVGIGAGYFSHFHYDAWRRLEGTEIVAVADLDKEKAEAVAEKHGITRVYTEVGRMVEEEQPDFVDVITPPGTHLDICRRLADWDVAVICQKPLAPTCREAVILVETMAGSGNRFMVHENWRWQPWYRETKKILNQGSIGAPFSLYFRLRMGDGWGEDAYLGRQPYFREYRRLFMFETGVHFVDTFRYLFGEPGRVFSRHRRLNPVIKGEDSVFLWLEFRNGTTAVLDANRYNESEFDADPRYTFGTMRIDASDGHLLLDADGTLRLKQLGKPEEVVPLQPPKRGFCGDSCFFLQQHFRDCLLTGEPFESEGANYLKTLQIVEKCYESAEKGQVLSL